MILTTEDVVNTILAIGEDEEDIASEGVPADAMVMVKNSQTGLISTVDSVEYEPETNTFWLNVSEY